MSKPTKTKYEMLVDIYNQLYALYKIKATANLAYSLIYLYAEITSEYTKALHVGRAVSLPPLPPPPPPPPDDLVPIINK